MANFFVLFFSIVSFSILFYYIGKYSKWEKICFESMGSELSDPTVNIPPIFFKRTHYQVLEVLFENDPFECDHDKINNSLWKKWHSTYERDLFKDWYINRRTEVNAYWKWVHHLYTITSKGKDALIRYNNLF